MKKRGREKGKKLNDYLTGEIND